MSNDIKQQFNIPSKVLTVLQELEQAGFEAYLVGGCVRDLLRGVEPKDWDITTNAKPKEILRVFPDGKYENQFGTVMLPIKYVKNVENENNESGKGISDKENIEITTYRIESTYSDRRRPDEVKFAKTLEEDLSRRDFTCNAIALRLNYEIIDLFNGVQDIQDRVIRAVGDPNERFNEDALRMMRAVRFAAQLSKGDDLQFLKDRKGIGRQNEKAKHQTVFGKNFEFQISNFESNLNDRILNSKQKKSANKTLKNSDFNQNSKLKIQNSAASQRWWIGENTFKAIKKNKDLLRHISAERIRDEFEKIILSDRPAWGVELLVETGLMKYIIPEIYDAIGVRQNRHHYYGPFNTVYKHMLAALKTCPSDKLEVRLAAFLHDIGKPKAKRGRGYNSTFYGHEYVGAKMTKTILERLKFPRQIIDKTVLLVKNHMFYYNVDEVGEKGVRKVIRKVGLENINDLIDVRIGDRLGSGVAKAVPYKLRHFKYMVEKVSHDPISVKQLKVNGNDLISELNIKPGPKIGAILEVLLAEVIDNPKLNDKKLLLERAKKLQEKNLETLKQKAKEKIAEEKQEEEQEIKKKYWVK